MIAELELLVPPPATGRTGIDWSQVFEALSTPLPSDYVALIERYGAGTFDSYLRILEPFPPTGRFDLLRLYDERTEAMEILWDEEDEPKPAALEDGGGRLIPWAATGAGEYFYWLARPDTSPEEWTVLVNEGRGPEWEHYELSCVGFLVASLRGEIESELLSLDYPTEPHTFVAAGAPRA